MIGLLRVEWLKLKGYRPFWVLSALYPVALGFALFVSARFHEFLLSKQVPGSMMFTSHPFHFPLVWHSAAYAASYLHFIPGVLIMLTVCNEFQFRTHRQNLLDGWSRAQFFLAKLTVMLAIVGLNLTWTALAGLLCGLALKSAPTLAGLEILGYFGLQSLVYGCLALAIGFTFRRGLLGLAFFLLYSNLLEKIARVLLGRWLGELAPAVGYLTPLACVDALVPAPVRRQLTESLLKDQPAPSMLAAAGACWCLVMLGWCFFRLRKEDL